MDARRTELGLSWRQVAEAANVTVTTVNAVRRGSNDPSPLTRRGIEKALQWAPGSIQAILDGREPAPAQESSGIRLVQPPADEPGDEGLDEKLDRAQRLLAEGMALLEELRRERRESG